MKKVILKVIIGTIILETILVCFFILLGDFNEVSLKSMGSLAIILECSIPCLVYAKIYDNPKYKIISTIGAIISSISAIILILMLWTDLKNEIIAKSVVTLQDFMWILVPISKLLSYNSEGRVINILKKISICAWSVLSIFVLVIIWLEKFPEGFVARLFWIITVLAVAGNVIFRIYNPNSNANQKNIDSDYSEDTSIKN